MKYFIVIIVVLLSRVAICQELDTAKVILNSKMRLTEFLDSYEDEEYYTAFVSFMPTVKFLNAKGFDGNFVFYSLRVSDTTLLADTISQNKIRLRPFFQFYEGEVVFAFNQLTNAIYRLSGVEGNENDVRGFFNDFKTYYQTEGGGTFKCEKLNSEVKVAGLDLACLCESLNKKKNCGKTMGKYYRFR